MLADSVGHDGKVNLNTLKALQSRWANDQKEHELSNSKFEGAIASTVRAEYTARIDRATKEVLGLIPKSEWHYSDTVMNNVIGKVKHSWSAATPIDYVCEVPNHNFNPSTSLTAQGVQCRAKGQHQP